ncbi:hypothetical protein CCHL11_08809 [Colletotrichum chlorophyti]|uniref:Uncharacterized protein n=1 Tax=Colletotrichum chlorophyti TaxID=708187 RepID=A0A1Q8RZ98_9PEZI|nr:hypothetical protein CCHL11_08809 [Colletotrichum chlorophyti]
MPVIGPIRIHANSSYTSVSESHTVFDIPQGKALWFTTISWNSTRFQGDIRRKDLIDYFDVDVVWSDVHERKDGFGNVRGMGLVQRLKLWRDRYSTYHSLTIFANRASGHQYREFEIHNFDGELRNRDDRHRQVRLTVRGSRRSSAPDSSASRSRFAFTHRMRPRVRSGSQGGSSVSDGNLSAGSLDIRYLGIQFSKREGTNGLSWETIVLWANWKFSLLDDVVRKLISCVTPDYRRFLETWVVAHSSDSEFHGIPFPPNHIELPSPQILPGEMSVLSSPDISRGLQPVVEPPDAYESDANP